MFVRLDGNGALYQQVTRGLRHAIIGKELSPGARLPGSRRIAQDLGVSRTVVLAALEQLLAEGYVESIPRLGTFVARRLSDSSPGASSELPKNPAAARFVPRWSRPGRRLVAAVRAGLSYPRSPQPPEIDFQYGSVAPDRLALKEIRRHHAAVIGAGCFEYSNPAGDRVLREEISDHLRSFRGLPAPADRIVITAGSQQALDVCARLFLDEDAEVVIEEPHYQGARVAFAATGARMRRNVVDDQGFDPARLPARAGAIRLVYVTPSHQFPTGSVMPLERRLALVAWAVRNNVVVVEDDYDSEFRYDCRPLEALGSLANSGANPVIYLGTFSKSLFPGLRMGYIVAQEGLVEALVRAKSMSDLGNPSISQRVLALFLGSGGYARHLRRMSAMYGARRERLVAALKAHFADRVTIQGTNAGLHLVVSLKKMTAELEPAVIKACAERGVGVYPMARYYLKRRHKGGLLLGYSGVDEDQIDRGVAELKRAYLEVCR